MNSSSVLHAIVGVAFVVFLVYVYNEVQNVRYQKFRGQSWQSWQKSNGTMDDNAIMSYKRLLRVPRKKRTYTDEFILDQIFNTNIPNSVETTKNGLDIHRRRIQKDERDHLYRTLTLLSESPQLNFLRETYDQHEYRRMRRDDIHPLFILDRLEPRVDRLPNAGEMRQRLQECRRQYIEVAQNDAVAGDVEDGVERTPQGKTDHVLDAGISHTSDPQNVHDSAVNISLRKTLSRLKWDHAGTIPSDKEVERCFAEASDFINRHGKDDDEKVLLNKALNQIAEGHVNSSLGEPEDRIFCIVWDRAKYPGNVATQRATSIKHAVLDALRDMISTNGNMVCISGRCGRLIASLSCVDCDPDVNKIQSLEMIKNEILERAKGILDECIKEAKDSSRACMNEISREYTDPLYERGDEEERGLLETARREFQENLNSRVNIMFDGYRTDVTPKDLENLRAYALSAIE